MRLKSKNAIDMQRSVRFKPSPPFWCCGCVCRASSCGWGKGGSKATQLLSRRSEAAKACGGRPDQHSCLIKQRGNTSGTSSSTTYPFVANLAILFLASMESAKNIQVSALCQHHGLHHVHRSTHIDPLRFEMAGRTHLKEFRMALGASSFILPRPHCSSGISGRGPSKLSSVEFRSADELAVEPVSSRRIPNSPPAAMSSSRVWFASHSEYSATW